MAASTKYIARHINDQGHFMGFYNALRAGASVMGCLSGEPGTYLETEGFITDEIDLLTTLTSYLGTGYAYGIERLRAPFETKPKKKSHIVIVTDKDIFSMRAYRNRPNLLGLGRNCFKRLRRTRHHGITF